MVLYLLDPMGFCRPLLINKSEIRLKTFLDGEERVMLLGVAAEHLDEVPVFNLGAFSL